MSCPAPYVRFFCATLLLTLMVGVHSSISSGSHPKLNNLQKQMKTKEEELKNAEAMNKNFEKMIQLVNILGQIDTFLTERTKGIIKKLAVLVEDEQEIKRHFSSEED